MIKASRYFALCGGDGSRLSKHLFPSFTEALDTARAVQRRRRRLGIPIGPISVEEVCKTPIARVYSHSYIYVPEVARAS